MTVVLSSLVAAGCGLGNDFGRFEYDEVSREDFVADLSSRICGYALRCETKFPALAELEASCVPDVLADQLARWSAGRRLPLTASGTQACLAAWPTGGCDVRMLAVPAACRALFDPQPDGALCATDWNCQSGVCQQLLDQCAAPVCARLASEGEGCAGSADCAEDLFCGDAVPRLCEAKVGLLGGCSTADGCEAGLYCDLGTDTCQSLADLGETCLSYDGVDPCGGALVCDGAGGTPQCVLGGVAGAACDAQSPCAVGGRCVANQCVTLVSTGELCTTAGACPELQACVGGACTARPRLGESCDAALACLEGACRGGVCALPVISEACGADLLGFGTECREDAYCRDGSCRALLGAGGACSASSDCEENLVCPATGGGAGQCAPCS